MQIGLFKIPVIRLLLLMILSQCYLLQAQWTRQSPIPTGQTITNVCFINPDTGWVFGYEGSIFRTNDRGETWIDQSLPIADVAVGLFLDENQGWIGLFSNFFNNWGEIYRTSDGGYNWELQFSDHTCAIRDLSFINPETGWALACHNGNNLSRNYHNFFLKTVDGGENWFFLDSIEQFYFMELDFVNDDIGYIAGAGTPNLMKTEDGGETWQESPHVSDASLTDVLFTDIDNGFSCGNNLYYTHNSGDSWSSTYCYHSFKVGMYNDLNGWTISFDKIYKVTNGGENVEFQFAPDKSVLADISVVDATHAMVAGRDVCVFSTSDGGETWQEKSSGAKNHLNTVFFLNENDGWAGGEERTLLITRDGGQHWIYHDLGSDYPVTDIQFINPDTGFLVNGNVKRSTDGGLNWSLTAGWTYPISDLYFLDSQLGWCVGADGRLFVTINGGVDWEGLNSGTVNDLDAVFFTDKNTGWIAGSGIVKKTSDGGETWEESYAGPEDFLKIQFFDESAGYILADRLYLKTSTGGESWDIVIPEGMIGPYSLEDICFINQETGYLSGNNYLLKTTDGGANWDSMPGLPEIASNAIFFTDELKGWIVGDEGAIYHTETGGTVSINNPGNEDGSLSYVISPNPSGDLFKIKYIIESVQDAEIGIYNLQGLKIRYWKETGLNPGSYSFDWDPVNLPPGIYLCKIRIGGYTGSEKIVYIK
jgi:photosystem II stability/assembly factor-like uncharacterized protein